MQRIGYAFSLPATQGALHIYMYHMTRIDVDVWPSQREKEIEEEFYIGI